MKFNEDSRVKIPAILHLTRLGYSYLSLKGQKWDESCNIFPDIFRKGLQRISPKFINLTQLRDWLLPMLMNGQVKVGGVEQE